MKLGVKKRSLRAAVLLSLAIVLSAGISHPSLPLPSVTSPGGGVEALYSSHRSTGPDLEIGEDNISVSPDPVRAGDTCFLTAEIFNIGDEPAYLVNVSFTVDGESLGSPIALVRLEDGTSDNVTKMWQPQEPGNHTIGVVIDPGGDIGETNENNNAASLVVPVYARGNVQPSVNITHPADMETVRGTVIISGSAHDNPGDENELVRVEVRIDGGDWNEANGLQAWQYGWDTTGLSEGLHTLSARSYDGEDHSAVDSIRAVVDNDPTNQPPIALISNPRTNDNFSVNETVFFQGNESRDPDDGPLPLNHTWELGDGTVLYGANINYSFPSKSPLILVTLSVYDGDMESSDTVQICVDNTPPVAVAGPDRSADIRERITFNGSGSYDPDAPHDGIDLSDYRWYMGNGDVLTGPVVNYTYEEGGGSYEVILTVTDGKGATDNDSLVVTLNNALPVAVLDIPSSTTYVGADLYFSAVNSYDPDGEVMEYYFDFGDGHSTGWLSRSGADHIYSATGEYHPRLKVKDSQGGTSQWNSRDITAIPLPNEVPGITITSPLPDAVVSSPLTVSGSSSDPDAQDEIERVEVEFEGILVLGGPRGGTSLKEWKAVFSDIDGIPNGPAEIRARAFDGTDYSDFVILNIVVNNDRPKSIEVNITDLSTEVFPGDNIDIRGQAKYDTGVVVAGATATVSLLEMNTSTTTEANGSFFLSHQAPSEAGNVPVEIRVEKNSIVGVVNETTLIYQVDFIVKKDSIKLYRGQEEIVGYNDAPRKEETVELRVEVLFHSDATDGPTFTGHVNICQTVKGSTTHLIENESVNFTPDGKEQSTIHSLDWTPDEGSNTITVNIAADRDSSPENNMLSRSFTVRERESFADFAVTEIRLQKEDIVEGETVSVAIEIENPGDISGHVNVSLYEVEEEEEKLVERNEWVFLKSKKIAIISINWEPSRGNITLLVVLDSSLKEENKENNRFSKNILVYPPEKVKKEKTSAFSEIQFWIGIFLLGIIILFIIVIGIPILFLSGKDNKIYFEKKQGDFNKVINGSLDKKETRWTKEEVERPKDTRIPEKNEIKWVKEKIEGPEDTRIPEKNEIKWAKEKKERPEDAHIPEKNEIQWTKEEVEHPEVILMSKEKYLLKRTLTDRIKMAIVLIDNLMNEDVDIKDLKKELKQAIEDMCSKRYSKVQKNVDSIINELFLIQMNREKVKRKDVSQRKLTYYEILEITQDAGQESIRKAYKQKICQYHPDKVQFLGIKLRALAEEEAKKINEAYDVLKNQEAKEAYDIEMGYSGVDK